jgi:subtilase family serine protease
MTTRTPNLGGLIASLSFAVAVSVQAEPTAVFGPPEAEHVRPPLWVNVGEIDKPGSVTSISAAPYTPQQVQGAYGFNALYTLGTLGEGQTIALVDAYDDTASIQNDLNAFDTEFGLPATTVQILYAQGSQPVANSGWQLEESLDVEWAHAIAPAAKIMLVEATDNATAHLLEAVQVAVENGATVVSMSWGGGEYDGETLEDAIYFTAPGVTYVASAGDGAAGVEWPAASPYVIGVGGTSLVLNSLGNYSSETTWSNTGGGISIYESQPSWQNHWFESAWTPMNRGVPDVGYLADPNFGVYVADQGVWYEVGGTSAGAPQWAALIALANQRRTTNFSGADKAIYSIANGGGTTSWGGNTINSNYFHDIKSGNDGSTQQETAHTGYDLVTGVGTPVASNLVPALTAYGAPPPANFGISVSPALRHIPPGGTASYTVTITPSNGYSGTVNFSVSGLPTGASDMFSSTSVTGSGTTTLSIPTTTSTALGTNVITITGTDSTGAPRHSVTASLAVTNKASTVVVTSIKYTNTVSTNLTIRLVIDNNAGSAVANASVSIAVSLNGSAYATGTGSTGPAGNVVFTLDNAPAGTYTTTVTAVTATGLTWNGTYPSNSYADP